MKRFFFVPFFFLIFKVAFSQAVDFNNYVPIRSSGVLPKEFSTSSLEKYLEAKKKISSDKSKIEKEALKDYELETNFAIDDIFHSGKVIFNDTISNYVNAVMRKILEQREKKKNVRVYVLRSSVVNAFSTGKGIIFVTMGLLARMQNEAELAYVLSHEYVHYLKKHSINDYIESKKAQYGKGQYNQTSIDEKYLRRSNFSKEQELEADELGFDLFTKSNYNITAAASSLNTIWYYYLPFDSITFMPSYFERGTFHIPSDYFKNDYTAVNAVEYEKNRSKGSSKDDDEDASENDVDKYSTHPSTDTRIEKLKQFENGFEGNKNDRSYYLVSEAGFKYIRKLSQFEIPHINLIDGDYEYAMYHAMILLQKDPKSLYLRKIIGKALYSMARYGNAGHFNDAHFKAQYTQGHFQQLVYLMGKLKAQGLSAAAMNYCWELKTEYPNDEENNAVCRSMMRSIVLNYENVKKPVFYQSLADTSTKKVKAKSVDDNEKNKNDDEEDDSNTKKVSKSSKSKKVKRVDAEDDNEDYDEESPTKTTPKEYFKRSFIYWFEKDTAFTNLYNAKMKELKKKKTKVVTKKTKNASDLSVNSSDVSYVENNKVILIDPFYAYYTQKGYQEEVYDPISSEQNKTRFTDALFYVAGKVFHDYEVLDQELLKTDEAEKLSEITIIRDCLFENLNKKGIGLVSTDLSEVKKIAEKYHATNIVLTGVVSEKIKGVNLSTQCAGCYSAMFYPIFIAQNSSRSYQYIIYTVLYNSEIDDFRVSYYKVIRGKDNETSLTANLFQILSRVKTY